ncbi:ribonuclease HII [Planoprotostelium fungivorum]|uniref:Ribonuclease n=1 Tax=Planoprotostelium fungivorum TaxID=1890364 RepID=A0A2P6NF42_9EUKA|nr:ribonuclease HII [Planoprotostelium fungivorum]
MRRFLRWTNRGTNLVEFKSPSHSFVSGVDETGRGAVVGPLVLCTVSMTADTARILVERGDIRDSKQLSPKMIQSVASQLRDTVGLCYTTHHITSQEIDARIIRQKSLDELQVEHTIRMLQLHSLRLPLIGSPLHFEGHMINFDGSRYKLLLDTVQDKFPLAELHMEPRSDDTYIQVAVASILAKDEREREVRELKETYGVDFGSGYPSDEKTRRSEDDEGDAPDKRDVESEGMTKLYKWIEDKLCPVHFSNHMRKQKNEENALLFWRHRHVTSGHLQQNPT